MLRFAVFEHDRPAQDWQPVRAYCFGPQGIPVQAQIRFEDGCVVCEKTTDEAAGFSVQIDLDAEPYEGVSGALGRVTVQTCLLPERDEPYLLALELARERIMAFLNKLEDWGLFDASAQSPELAAAMAPVMEQFERARGAFTKALVAQRGKTAGEGGHGFNPEADQLARHALALAFDAGERLAVVGASRDLPKRIAGAFHAEAVEHYKLAHNQPPPPEAPIIFPGANGVVLPTRPLLGCSVDATRFDPKLAETVASTCDFMGLPMRWVDMEPVEGRYTFKPTDKWIEWAVRKARMPITAGPVIDFRPGQMPTWLYVWENDYETLRELIYEHVKQVVTRYRRTIRRWTIATGLHVNTNFRLGFEQMMDLTRVAVLVLRKLHPQARVQLEITQPWGEYYAQNRKSLPPQAYAEMVSQVGINVDAYALRLQLGQPKPGQATRDLMALSSILDRYATSLERPIAVTLGAPSAELEGDEKNEHAGNWRDGWSPDRQADWLNKAAAIALAKPYVHSVCWQDLIDPAQPGPTTEMPSGALIDRSGEPKPALAAFKKMRQAVREPSQVPGVVGW